MSYLIKVLDEQNQVVDMVTFKDNLTIPDAPAYVNFNGRVGLTRCNSKRYNGELVICFFYPEKQEDSYAEFISETDAYNICAKRNKLHVAQQLGLKLTNEVEII